MTDDISKVYAALRSIRYNANNGSQDRPLHHRLSLIANEADKAIAAIESTAAPAEVGEYTHAQRESMIAAMRRDAAEYCLFGLDYLSSAAHDYATLARQLAEAKAEIEHRTSDVIVVGGTALACSQAVKEMFDLHKSQLAAATRRLGEVDGLVGEWRAEVERGTGHLNDESDRAMLSCADELEAALTKEPTK